MDGFRVETDSRAFRCGSPGISLFGAGRRGCRSCRCHKSGIAEIGRAAPIGITQAVVGITPASIVGITPAAIIRISVSVSISISIVWISAPTPGAAPAPRATTPTAHEVEGSEECLGRERGQGRCTGDGCGQQEPLVPGHDDTSTQSHQRRTPKSIRLLITLVRMRESCVDENQRMIICQNPYSMIGHDRSASGVRRSYRPGLAGEFPPRIAGLCGGDRIASRSTRCGDCAISFATL